MSNSLIRNRLIRDSLIGLETIASTLLAIFLTIS